MVQAKAQKFRGKRTHGRGSPKKGRGAGGRGGRGRAGMGKKAKHHRVNLNKEIMEIGRGNKGFVSRQSRTRGKSINLDQIEQHLDRFKEEGSAVVKGGRVYFDAAKAGYAKVLGRGSVGISLVVENAAFTKRAREKLGVVEESVDESA